MMILASEDTRQQLADRAAYKERKQLLSSIPYHKRRVFIARESVEQKRLNL